MRRALSPACFAHLRWIAGGAAQYLALLESQCEPLLPQLSRKAPLREQGTSVLLCSDSSQGEFALGQTSVNYRCLLEKVGGAGLQNPVQEQETEGILELDLEGAGWLCSNF